jgi:uncharacterized protein YkwD
VSPVPVELSRRTFLKAAVPCSLALSAIARGQELIERGRFNEADIPLAREQLLQQVNAERAAAGLSQLQLDELACTVAGAHARDMAQGEFLSHWGSDGRKPYHRYSFAGGTDALQENASSADGIQSATSAGVLKALRDMHQSMIDEVKPHDGHRKTILYPQHTHVGFGIATHGLSVRLDELYLARFVKIDPLPQEMKTGASELLSGKLLSSNSILTGVEIFYEPLPTPPDISWLREARSYGMPESTEKLLPRLAERLFYPDGSNGSIEIDSGNRFRVRVRLSKKPGINTLMVWIKTAQTRLSFPGAQICVRVQ